MFRLLVEYMELRLTRTARYWCVAVLVMLFATSCGGYRYAATSVGDGWSIKYIPNIEWQDKGGQNSFVLAISDEMLLQVLDVVNEYRYGKGFSKDQMKRAVASLREGLASGKSVWIGPEKSEIICGDYFFLAHEGRLITCSLCEYNQHIYYWFDKDLTGFKVDVVDRQ